MRKLQYLFAGLTLAMLLVAMPGNAQNVIPNPGFEGGVLDPWADPMFGGILVAPQLDQTVSHSGNSSVKFTGVPDNGGNSGNILQWVDVVPGTTYELSVWTKASGLHLDIAPLVQVLFADWAGASESQLLEIPHGTDWDWTENKTTIVCPQGMAHAWVRLMMMDYAFGGASPNTGTIWFDDVSLAPPPTVATVQGTIDLQNYGGDKTAVPVSIDLNGTVSTVNLDADGNFSIADVAFGNYTIRVKASHWLAKAITVDVNADTNLGIVSLINGDAVDSNEVDWDDYNAVVDAFGSLPGDSNWNANADLDGTGEVDWDDFNIAVDNFGAVGE